MPSRSASTFCPAMRGGQLTFFVQRYLDHSSSRLFYLADPVTRHIVPTDYPGLHDNLRGVVLVGIPFREYTGGKGESEFGIQDEGLWWPEGFVLLRD